MGWERCGGEDRKKEGKKGRVGERGGDGRERKLKKPDEDRRKEEVVLGNLEKKKEEEGKDGQRKKEA